MEQQNIPILQPNTFYERRDIHPTAKIGRGAYIGENVSIGKSVRIGSGAYIAPGTHIGDYTIILPNAVIGALPFQFYTDKKGTPVQRSARGSIHIGKNVTIGACTCIDRPAEPDEKTIIGDGTRIDNLCQIAHGVTIGNNCRISAQTGIGGNAIIGNNCIFNGQTGIADHAIIPDGTITIARAGLHGKAYKPYSTLAGSPAMPAKLFRKICAALKHLPERNTTPPLQKKSFLKRIMPLP